VEEDVEEDEEEDEVVILRDQGFLVSSVPVKTHQRRSKLWKLGF